MHWLLFTLTTVDTGYCVHWLLCTLILKTLATVYTDYCRHWLLYALVTVYTDYCRHWLLCTLVTVYTDTVVFKSLAATVHCRCSAFTAIIHLVSNALCAEMVVYSREMFHHQMSVLLQHDCHYSALLVCFLLYFTCPLKSIGVILLSS